MKGNIIVLIFILYLVTDLHSQNEDIYIIVRYNYIEKSSPHKKLYYFYASKLSDVDNFYPFYTHGYNLERMEQCCAGDSTYLFTYSENATFNFDSLYYSGLSQIRKIFNEKMRSYSKINIKYSSGRRVKIQVSYVAIKGDICLCNIPIISDDNVYSKFNRAYILQGNVSLVNINKQDIHKKITTFIDKEYVKNTFFSN